jgi:hypothetical protein
MNNQGRTFIFNKNSFVNCIGSQGAAKNVQLQTFAPAAKTK